MNIGKVIKSIRKEQGVTQGLLAKSAGITQTYLSLIETGEKRQPSLEVIESICTALGVSPAVIFWLAISEGDIKPEKAEIFKILKPLIDQMIKEIL